MSTSPARRLGIGHVLEHEHLGAAVLVDPHRLHRRHTIHVRRAELEQLAEELGLDAVGATPRGRLRGHRAAHPRAAGARALRRHELHDGAARGLVPSRDPAAGRAHGRLGRALLLRARARAAAPGRAACRATRGATRYAELREKLDELGRRLGGEYRVLVDANQHVDREAAARSGVGFYGKNTMLITRRHGSWVVLGTLVTDARARADAAARRRLRRVPPLHRRLPDGRARRARHARRDEVPLVLDAGAGGDPGGLPRARSARRSTAATSARTSARGTAASRSAAPATPAGARRTSRSSTGSRRTTTSSSRATTASSSRATTAAGCGATRSSRSATSAGRRSVPRSRARGGRRRAVARARAWALASSELANCVGGLDAQRGSTPSSFASSRARAAMRARSSSGSRTIASPRFERISLTSHSALPTGISRSAPPSASCGRRARSPSGRSPACSRRARPGRRAVASARSPRAARTSPSSSFALRMRSSRKVRSPSLVRSHVWTYQCGSARSNEYGSTSRVDGCPSPSFWYSISTRRRSSMAARERADRDPPRRARPSAPASARARTRRTSPRASCARGRAACARRRRSSGRRTRARAGSRAPRAASGAAASGTCRRRAPCRRARPSP